MVSEPLLRVQYRLTDRDLRLLGWLADHGVLTTPQIAHALYPSLDFAQRRLLKLLQTGVVDRFRPQRPDGGSHPYHYLLAQLGVEVFAAQRAEEELPRKDRARKTRWWLTNRANLPHRLAVNGFFTDLAGYARTHPDTGLERWWPSSRCQQPGAFAGLAPGMTRYDIWGATIAADGHGVWTQQATGQATGGRVVRVPFFAEIDLGTEDLGRLAGKVAAYQRFTESTGWVWPVLFWLPSTLRERHLHTKLAEHRSIVPVATTRKDPPAMTATPTAPTPSTATLTVATSTVATSTVTTRTATVSGRLTPDTALSAATAPRVVVRPVCRAVISQRPGVLPHPTSQGVIDDRARPHP